MQDIDLHNDWLGTNCTVPATSVYTDGLRHLYSKTRWLKLFQRQNHANETRWKLQDAFNFFSPCFIITSPNANCN